MTEPPRMPRAGAVAPQDLVDALYFAQGERPLRAMHAKCVLLEGFFTAAPAARALTSAKLFACNRSAAIARFSEFSVVPYLAQIPGAARPHGFALKLTTPHEMELDIVTQSVDGFPARTAAEFRELLLAVGLNADASVVPTPLDRFLANHPAAKRFFESRWPTPVSCATTTYFGVNAFRFRNSKGARCHVRYRFVPPGGERFLEPSVANALPDDYLLTELAERIARAPIRFDWLVQIADPADPIDDPSVIWPSTRRFELLGTVTLERLAPLPPERCGAMLFLPANLPDGIAAADPMLTLRNAAYPLSYRRRQDSGR
jgi:catalase